MADALQPRGENIDWRDQVTWYTHETGLIKVVKLIGGLILPRLIKVECRGAENIPATGRCIVASNHINNFDVIFMGLCLPRHPHFMAKKELYRNPMLAWFIRLAGSFPINRGEKDPWAMEQAGRILEAEQLLFMFPEGTRGGRTAQLKRGKIGAIKLALDHQAPLVPAVIFGTQYLGRGWRGHHPIKIKIGQPLDLAALAGSPPYEYETVRKLTGLLMQHIAAMLPPAHRGVYAEAIDDEDRL